MQQTMVFQGGPYRRLRADHQAPNADHAAWSAGTPELVARASSGDQVAWDQLVERYGGVVWTVARAYGLGSADAGDVSQVTWLLLTQHLGALQRPERLGGWLLRTATREADRMRRLRGCEDPTPTRTLVAWSAARMGSRLFANRLSGGALRITSGAAGTFKDFHAQPHHALKLDLDDQPTRRLVDEATDCLVTTTGNAIPATFDEAGPAVSSSRGVS